jgi:dCTP deaminase
MILSGDQIRQRGIIHPHKSRTEITKADTRRLSYGEGPAGYDVRVEFDAHNEIRRRVIRPSEFLLASTVEYFIMPNDVIGLVKDKSSWARRGISVFNTVIEPGWCGYLTLEIVNHSDMHVTIEMLDPIAQVIFELVDGAVQPYNGKYQGQQKGPQNAR